ncbi:MAG: hypothetical protein COW00_06765 [Bdellovibrio sp. CG12_big_fil_rev_8_21_14_0_65_39_13]|nr:MAG: hypothetical protein COW78_10615 [Bdellovibrio sp. CG22_combo_CG10-13_8_21_14_all_39_27]PIQ60454.1 MAG: hypothetical protein COW00_06765 [Bdellovibrio sp. CG12_big_fil_rev_8_21_14_0_65_39_13]PIR36104.1 MAG: hypothetical protein COV37_05000 [Bdellovibrio sp. CG11_big_fil_rev_8_21_14_0_20_39_38]
MGKLILAKLNEEQIRKAKEVNGVRKGITHVLICGKYGNIFGTEKFCRKYFNAWRDLFKELFNEIRETGSISEISSYQSTSNIVNALIIENDALERSKRKG